MTCLLLTALGLAVAASSSPGDAQSSAATAELLEAATRYVVDHEKAFSLLVSQEHYVQEIQRPTNPGTNLTQANPGGGMQGGGAVLRQVLRSDFLLVQLGPGQGVDAVPRCVREVNGTKVRDREDPRGARRRDGNIPSR